jgi:RNA polymerase sigma factor for flagellar operon FliA
MSNPYEQSLKDYRNSLVIDYMPAVKAMAARLKERLPRNIDFNDLVSIGLEELVKLSKRYDPKQNDNFWGYAQKRVYGAMLDFLRSLDTISRADRKLVKEIYKITEEYMVKFGTTPSDEYLAEVLDEDIKKIKKVKTAGEIYNVMPMEEQLNYFENIFKKVEIEELIDIIKKVLKEINEKEQLVIQLYYFKELSLKEISEILNVSESRVSQIHSNAIKKIREKLNG